MNIKKYKKENGIYILFIITIFLSNLFIGTPIRYNIMYINLLLNIMAIGYMIIKCMKKKERIPINKFDLCVGIIAFSTFIPLIFNTYLRLADTIEYILRYISVLNIYIISRILTKERDTFIKTVTNIIIGASVLLIIFGIDCMTGNVFQEFYEILGTAVVYNESKNRMSSLFKYPNVFAIFLVVTILLSIMQYIHTENKKKRNIYPVVIFMQIFALVMTYSRLSWIIFFISVGMYWLLIKDRKVRKQILKIVSVSGINAFVYLLIFNKLQMNGNYFLIYAILIIQGIFQYVVMEKFQSINLGISGKHIIKICIIILIVITVIGIGYIYLTPDTLVLFNNINSKKTYRKQNMKVEPNTEYVIEFDIEAETNSNESFKIECKELDKNEKELKIHEIQFDDFKGKKEIEFCSNENTETMTIVFNKNEDMIDGKLKVHSVTINGQEERINYKIIPIELVNRICKIKFDTASVEGRLNYYKESIDIIKNHIGTGIGGYGWKNSDINKIDGGITEHSYPLQLFLQFGVISFSAYGLLIVFLIKQAIKVIKNKDADMNIIGIIVVFFALILHSTFDFDMYFLNMLLILYMYIGIFVSKTNKDEIYISHRYSYIYVVIIIIAIYFSLGEITTQYIDTDKISDYEKKLDYIDLKIILVPYDYRYREDKVNCLSTMKNKGIYEEESEAYIQATKEILEEETYILEIEKHINDNDVNKIILNYIDLINENNENEILKKIEEQFSKIGSSKTEIYVSMKSRFNRKYINERIETFLNKLKQENNIDE